MGSTYKRGAHSTSLIDLFQPDTFGSLYADEYDTEHDPGTTEQTVALLKELADGGRALELAIGSGRVALPLHAAGVDVRGFDASAQMLDLLRAKPGGQAIQTEIADMANFLIEDGPFDLAYLVFNTFFNLTSQADQLSCLQHTARHLRPGGKFLLETFIPDLSMYNDPPSLRTLNMDTQQVVLEAAQHDPVTQVLEFQRIFIRDGQTQMKPLVMRYAMPPEIDLMARLAGMSLDARWGDWDRRPFTAESGMHISVYRKD